MDTKIAQNLQRIYGGTTADYLTSLKNAMDMEEKKFVITANAEVLMMAETNETIREMLKTESVSMVPDGISIVNAMKKFDIPVQERVTGVDLTEGLLRHAGENGKTVCLLGATEEVVRALEAKLRAAYPKMILECHNGYDGDKDQIFENIKLQKPDFVVTALGVPSQELLIYRHYKDFDKGIFIGVGGTFDVLSGLKKRAPKIFLKTNTEWLYRITREPARLKRFYNSNIKFMRYLAKEHKTKQG